MGFAGVPGNFPCSLLCSVIFAAGSEWLMGRLVSPAQPPSALPAMLTCLPARLACACLFTGGDGHRVRGFAVNLQAFRGCRVHTAPPVVQIPSRHRPTAPVALAVCAMPMPGTPQHRPQWEGVEAVAGEEWRQLGTGMLIPSIQPWTRCWGAAQGRKRGVGWVLQPQHLFNSLPGRPVRGLQG